MKFKIKQYQNKFRMRFSESYYIYSRRFGKWWDEFQEKGHEKITVMFIPHNEKKIFNFQISKFTVLFFMGLFSVVLVTSAYAIIKNASSRSEEQRLLMNYKDIRSHLLKFEKLTVAIADVVEDMKPDIEEIYLLAAGENVKTDNIWKLEKFDPRAVGDRKNVAGIMPDEIFTLREIQKNIICSTNTIKTIKNFVDVRSKVVNDTPSIVPNFGNITSLFGWRRSPFGLGRDFHSGIDIAAPDSTEIHATAPGTVETAGWMGGYGYTVRIKHKYGFETIYGHCSRLAVSQGDSVAKGQLVAYVGQTGSATGNHCHYEIRLGNVSINPYPYMSRIW